ncbi:MAG: hypothetical protein AB8B81_17310 [Halioglobus sp.]
MAAIQSSQLLSSLFEHCDMDSCLTVLHVGPALPETVEFFSRFRCKLFFVDLFSVLPFTETEGGPTLEEQFSTLLDLPDGVSLDICLFWDVFNFLGSDAIAAFLHALTPHLHAESVAHVFAVYNLKTGQGDQLYGISDVDALNVRARTSMLPGYAPHPQSKLKNLLNCFNFDRSVLLSDSRLELLLSSKLNAL